MMAADPEAGWANADHPDDVSVRGSQAVRLERVQDDRRATGILHAEFHFSVDARQRAQMKREGDADHGSFWNSTDLRPLLAPHGRGSSKVKGDEKKPPAPNNTIDVRPWETARRMRKRSARRRGKRVGGPQASTKTLKPP